MTSPLVVIPSRRTNSNNAEVARIIGIDIIASRYKEGAKLPGDAELTMLFGISRPVLRESVKTLVAKGLLSTKARVGTVVRERAAWNMFDPDVLAWHLDAGIDARFLRDLSEIRLAVEPRAAALAAERRTDQDIALMRAIITNMYAAASRGAENFAEADLGFHLLIANASGNPFMRSIGAVIEAALRVSFRLSAPRDEREFEISVAAHERIVDAIAEKNSESAAAAMTNVIFSGQRRHRAAD
ncbi:FadR/GntR family transcriptional regulator [Beijerinckia indica]|uniref:GntR domain protein n=1 Tax=Beijerinckia indica subsp. indica (strain ATCC 9039 / DSM 1715 / NCIMB 8712) TaxID=395963 RepID=B2IBL7_BEII9|nr:FadR/GntR family transcriptional regulator [Beijerinckia indica]ACB96643.1 GntR domain protein [Beijerinckia indica subsp. indica ATCC 9039]